jgi:hypothetical protein
MDNCWSRFNSTGSVGSTSGTRDIQWKAVEREP